MRGGSALTLQTAVAVIPCSIPPCDAVMTTTLDPNMRIKALKRAASTTVSAGWAPDRLMSSEILFISVPTYHDMQLCPQPPDYPESRIENRVRPKSFFALTTFFISLMNCAFSCLVRSSSKESWERCT